MNESMLLKHYGRKEPASLAEYGPYAALEKARAMKPDELIELVKRSDLRGRGGAGFPAGRKWEFCRGASGEPKYLVCNSDESEPGTFKDIQIILHNPHLLLEGIAIAAYAIGASKAFIYIRWEYVRGAEVLERAIAELGGGMHGVAIHVHRGAGAYICGEETALLDSIEGYVGEPRLKPPFPATEGLFGKPTVINNVETLACLPLMLNLGLDAWKSIGAGGSKLFCVSGDVASPSVFEAPLGITLREVVYTHGGGPKPGRKIQAVFPGGSSTAPLMESELDAPMDFKTPEGKPGIIGAAAVICVDDSRCMVDVARNLVRFYAHESCGKCTPCRDGNEMIHGILERILNGGGTVDDLRYIEHMSKRIFNDCFCPLAKGSMIALGTIFRKWRADFDAHLAGAGCGKERM